MPINWRNVYIRLFFTLGWIVLGVYFMATDDEEGFQGLIGLLIILAASAAGTIFPQPFPIYLADEEVKESSK